MYVKVIHLHYVQVNDVIVDKFDILGNCNCVDILFSDIFYCIQSLSVVQHRIILSF